MIPVLTRAAGLSHFADVLPRLGADYARRRNFAPGPGDAPTTSLLSPWLRHRLLTEQEVVVAARRRHGEAQAQAFVQEIFWRTYFKGFLEQHPDIWPRYQQGVTAGRQRLASLPGLARMYRQAVTGTTGLDCFDAWTRLLCTTNWLHNHERMWFASIWIFTLGLPWELGAAFFEEHLIDADPASNTLGWRWVAGLHTVGKPYVARAENIARFTEGRFHPRGLLDEAPEPLVEEARPQLVGLPASGSWPELPFALLLHLEDGSPDALLPPDARVARLGILVPASGNPLILAAQSAAASDIAMRAEEAFGLRCHELGGLAEIRDWADGLPVATPYAPVGPARAIIAAAGATLVRRAWDSAYWPHCRRGFFQLRGQLSANTLGVN